MFIVESKINGENGAVNLPENNNTPDQNGKPECANCFACVKDTEMCPLNEHYDPNAYLKLNEKLRQRQKRK
jgi:hypothetical protein